MPRVPRGASCFGFKLNTIFSSEEVCITLWVAVYDETLLGATRGFYFIILPWGTNVSRGVVAIAVGNVCL